MAQRFNDFLNYKRERPTMRWKLPDLYISPWAWLAAGSQSLIIAIWIAVDSRISFSFEDAGATVQLVAVALIIGAGFTLYVRKHPTNTLVSRIRDMAFGLAFVIFAFSGIRILNHLTMTLPFPLADDLLESWDRALGLDWYAYAIWLGGYPVLHMPVHSAYAFTTISVAIIFLIVACFGKLGRAKEFAEILFCGALVSVTVGCMCGAASQYPWASPTSQGL